VEDHPERPLQERRALPTLDHVGAPGIGPAASQITDHISRAQRLNATAARHLVLADSFVAPSRLVARQRPQSEAPPEQRSPSIASHLRHR
jgi:hypothetical protein